MSQVVVSQDTVKEALAHCKVSLKYRKKNGEEREARGTTCLEHIPAPQHPKGVREYPDDLQRYYDLDSAGWRTFKWDSLIEAKW